VICLIPLFIVPAFAPSHPEHVGVDPPLKQIAHGISPNEIICNEGLNLAFKLSNNSPACVKPQTVKKLIERGWALPNQSIQEEQVFDFNDDKNPLQNINTKIPQASEILLECGRNSQCVVLHLQTLSETEQQELVLSVVNEIVTEWEDDDFYCHDIVHPIGVFLFGYFDGDLAEALSHVNNKCGNSLYHGVVENYLPNKVLLENIDVKEFDITIPCMELGSSDNSYVGLQCVHGMGHSLTKVYNYDVIEAVKRCDEFQTLGEQKMCQDGLFMENSVAQYKRGGGDFDENDIFYPCNKLDEKYQKQCYVYQGSYILVQNNFSPLDSFEQCEKLSSVESIRSCYFGVVNYMIIVYFNSIDKTATMCKEINPNYQKDCILIAVGDITVYVDPELGGDFCKLFPEEQTEYCIEQWKRVQEWHSSA